MFDSAFFYLTLLFAEVTVHRRIESMFKKFCKTNWTVALKEPRPVWPVTYLKIGVLLKKCFT